MRLFINDTEIDLPINFKIARTKQVNDIGSLEDRQTNYTQKLKIPKTKKNTQTFEQLGFVGSETNIPYQKNTVELFNVTGEKEINDGYAKFFGEFEDYYDIGIYDGYVSFTKAIENAKLSDVPLSGLNHLKNLDNVIETWTNPTLPYRYNIADYNGKATYDTNTLNIDYLIPSANVPYIWDAVFDYFGFTYEGSVFQTEDFQNLWLTYPKTIGEGTESLVAAFYNNWTELVRFFRADEPSNITLYTTSSLLACLGCEQVNNAYFIGTTQAVNFPINTPNNLRNEFLTPVQGGLYKIIISGIIFEGQGDSFAINVSKGGFQTSFPIEQEEITTVNAGQTFNIVHYINLQAGQPLGLNLGVLFTNPLGDIDIDIFFVEGNTVDFEEALIDFDVKGFVDEVLWRFALTPFKDKYTNNIRFLTHQEWLQTLEIVDLSYLYKGKTAENYIIGNYAQNNWLRYKYNEQGVDYNDGRLRILNYNLKESVNIIGSRIYSPERLRSFLLPTIQSNIYKFWNKEIKDDGTVNYKPLDNRFYLQRSILSGGFITVGSELQELDEEVATYYKESFERLSFTSIVNRYYLPIYSILNRSKIIKANLYLDDTFINALDFSKLYYIKQLGSYYLLNKIPNYISKGVYNCELIRVQYGLTDNGEIPPAPQIIIDATALEPNVFTSFNWSILTQYIFLNYVPASATIYMKQLTASPIDGGVYTGFEYTGAVNVNGTSFNQNLPILITTEGGWYEVQIIDVDGLQSNIDYVVIGGEGVATGNSINFNAEILGIPVEQYYNQFHNRNIEYRFNNFTPTSATLKIQAFDLLGGFAFGTITTVVLTEFLEGFWYTVTDVSFPPAFGFYKVTIETDVVNFQTTYFVY